MGNTEAEISFVSFYECIPTRLVFNYICIITSIYICIRMWLWLCTYLHNNHTSVIVLTGSRKPTLTKIIKYNIRDQATVDYYDLGVQLLPDNVQVQLDIIKKDNPTDARACCTEMFKYWLDVDTAASWNKLIQALKHINKNNLAETIVTQLLQGM